MNIRVLSFIILILFVGILITGCQLNPQSAKEKMAYNNTMTEIKARNYLDGKVGNIKYNGMGFTFDFTDSSLKKEEMEEMCLQLLTIYANSNNRAQTGQTVIKIFGKSSQGTIKAVYQAGPTLGDDIRSNVKFTWE